MSLAERLASERRGRLAAERLLELKQAELYAANRKLGLHARALSEEINETRAEVASVRDENARVKSDLSVATQNLEIAERRLWQSIQTIQDGFAFFDADDCLISTNDAYMVVFDGLEEIKPGVAYARILQLLTEEGIVDTGELSRADWRAHMLQRRQEDAPEPVVIRLWNDQYVKMVDHRGAGGDIVSLGLNITATVRYERDLKDARARAEAAARAKSAFLANMSHEIRTPMNGVVGMAELLADSDLSDEQALYVDTIRNSGEALLVIINDILDYSKIEAEKMVLHNAPFDLEKCVHEVQMLVQPAAREKDIALLLDYDMFLPHQFIGDVGRIRQILTNLIGNAVKFTSDGHVLVRITGSPSSKEGTMFLHIAIEDTGIGIEKSQLEQIFGEFTQVEDERNRKFEGTGLGLAISKRLVELMGGEIWADSEVGVGSCFGFKVPLGIANDENNLISPLPETLQKVMVVDDNEVNRNILRRQLEILNVATEGFATGSGALAHLAEGFDMIMLEHELSDTTCDQFIKDVRQSGFNNPIIVLTSNPGSLIGDEARKDISAVLQRPLPRARLISAVAELGARIAPESKSGEEDLEAEGPNVMFRRHTSDSESAPSVPDAAEMPLADEPSPSSADIAAPEIEQPPISAPDMPVEPPVADENTQTPTRPEPSADMSLEPEALPPEPEAASPAPSAPPPSEPEQPIAANAPPRKMRILAAEDNKTNQLVFRKMIQSLDIELKIANNGIEAVKAFESFKPDMIFMDISMPEMDGKEATGEIRKIEAITDLHTPIVALTAHAQDGDEKPILDAGLDFYLTKPLRKPAIHEMVRQLVPSGVIDPFGEETELRQAG